VPLSKVLGVVSFYTMFHQKPPGKYHVEVCRNITCAMLGAFDILHCVEKKLGVGHGERTADGKFSVEEVECLAGCSWAPAMRINGRYHEQMTPEKASQLLDSLK
jgi:NADH:ubiquinone oxidoreductase subunit E